MFDFYRFVHDSSWIGGSSEYSALRESAPYWFNGLVPLAFGLDDPRLKGQVYSFMDYVLDHQQADGWLGPEITVESRGLWGRCYFLLGLMVDIIFLLTFHWARNCQVRLGLTITAICPSGPFANGQDCGFYASIYTYRQ